MKDYVAIIEPAVDGTWGAYVPDLPGCTSGGVTRDEAASNIHEAVVGHIQALRENGDSVPEPTALVEVVHVA